MFLLCLLICWSLHSISARQTYFPGRTVDSPCKCNMTRAYAHHPSKFHRDQRGVSLISLSLMLGISMLLFPLADRMIISGETLAGNGLLV